MDNLTSIQEQLKTLLEEYEQLLILDTHLEGIKEQIEKTKSELVILDKKLDKELKDIQKLESIGVNSMFHKILGNKEEQLDKERQEFLEASLNFKEKNKSLELLNYEFELLSKKAGQAPLKKKQIDKLKLQRENEILKSENSGDKSRLKALLEEMDLCIMLNKELEEAKLEGEKCLKMLKIVLSYLKKARDWGKWDMHGSRRGNYSKNKAIDQAMKNLSKAQFQLDRFARELKDLGRSDIHFQIEASQFNKFTDFFFDNLISDWIVQQKIKSTIASVESSEDNVRRVMMNLDREISSCREKMSKLEREKDEIILS